MKTEHVFPTEQAAQEAWVELNRSGQRGRQPSQDKVIVAFRQGCRVYLRPEFASAHLARELASIAEALA